MLVLSGTKKFCVLDIPGRSSANSRESVPQSSVPSPIHPAVFGVTTALQMEGAEDDWIHVDVSNSEEVSELKETQFKLIGLIGALHQRLSALEEREEARNEQMNNIGHVVADLHRGYSDHSVGAKEAPVVRTDESIANAMKAELARLF